MLSVDSSTYEASRGAEADVLVNCNGNGYRYRANQDPHWDFAASVASVERSLHDFRAGLYVYVSTIDVYNDRANPERNDEAAVIDPRALDVYGFHKWLAERIVERFAPRSVIIRSGTAIGPGLKKGPIHDILTGQPLRMSLDSELSIIDTSTIARAVTALVARRPDREIVNVTGTGALRLRDLQPRLSQPIAVAPGADATIYRYHVNNEKLRSFIPVDASRQIAEEFLSIHTEQRACAS